MRVANLCGLNTRPYEATMQNPLPHEWGFDLFIWLDSISPYVEKLFVDNQIDYYSLKIRQDGAFGAVQYLNAIRFNPETESSTVQIPNVTITDRTTLLVGCGNALRQYGYTEWCRLADLMASSAKLARHQFCVVGYAGSSTLAEIIADRVGGQAVKTCVRDAALAIAATSGPIIGLEAALSHLAWGMGKPGIMLCRQDAPSCVQPPGWVVMPLRSNAHEVEREWSRMTQSAEV